MPRIKINKLPEGYQIKNGKITSNTKARKKKLPSYQAAPYKIANPYTQPAEGEYNPNLYPEGPYFFETGGEGVTKHGMLNPATQAGRNLWSGRRGHVENIFSGRGPSKYTTDFYNRQRLSPDPDAYSPNQVSGQTGGFNYDPWGSTRKDPRVIPSAYMSSPPLSPMEIKDNAMVPPPTRAEARRERLNNERAEQFRREMIPGYAERQDEAADLSSLATSEPRMPLSPPNARTAFETSSPLHEISPNQDLDLFNSLPETGLKSPSTRGFNDPHFPKASPPTLGGPVMPTIPPVYTTMPGADTSKPGGRRKGKGEGFNRGGLGEAAPGILAGSAALWGISQLGKNKKKPTRTNPYANLQNAQMPSRRPRRGSGMDIPTAMSLGFTQSYPSLYAKKGGNLPMYQDSNTEIPYTVADDGTINVSREVGNKVLNYRNVANTFHQNLMDNYGQRDLQATSGYSPEEASQLSGYPGYLEAMKYLEWQNPNQATKDTSGAVEGPVDYNKQFIGDKHFNYRGLTYPEYKRTTPQAKKGGDLPMYQKSDEFVPPSKRELKKEFRKANPKHLYPDQLGQIARNLAGPAAGGLMLAYGPRGEISPSSPHGHTDDSVGRAALATWLGWGLGSFNAQKRSDRAKGTRPEWRKAREEYINQYTKGGNLPMYQAASGRLSDRIRPGSRDPFTGLMSYGTVEGNNIQQQGADMANLPMYNPAVQNTPNPDANMSTVPNMFYAQQGGNIYNQQNPHQGATFEAERGEVIEHPPGNPAMALAHGGTIRNANNYQKLTGNKHSDAEGGSQMAGAEGGFVYSDFLKIPKDIVKQLEYLT